MINLFKMVLLQLLGDKGFCSKAWKKASAAQEQSSGLEESCVFVSGSKEAQIYPKAMMLFSREIKQSDIRCGFFFFQFFTSLSSVHG